MNFVLGVIIADCIIETDVARAISGSAALTDAPVIAKGSDLSKVRKLPTKSEPKSRQGSQVYNSLQLPRPPADNASEAEWDEWNAHNDDEYGSEAVESAMLALAESLGIPKLVAVAIIAENDNEYAVNTPEQRYSHVLAWTRSWLTRDRSTWTEKNMVGYIA